MPYRSVLRPGLFAGQTIVVTGGGSGIGRCTAHEISSLGAHVVITGRKPDKLAGVKTEIEQAGGSCETHAFDIREETQVKDAIAAIVAKKGRIHGLFNNAGGQFPAPAAAMSAKGFDVVAYDPDATLAARCAAGDFPIEEPGFKELFAAHRGPRNVGAQFRECSL